MGRTMVEVVCAQCGQAFQRDQFEVKRNAAKGRVNCCNRKCLAIYMNKAEAAREWQSKQSSENQFGEKNPNWRGGVSPPRKTKKQRKAPPDV